MSTNPKTIPPQQIKGRLRHYLLRFVQGFCRLLLPEGRHPAFPLVYPLIFALVIFVFVETTIEIAAGAMMFGVGEARYGEFQGIMQDLSDGSWSSRTGLFLIGMIDNVVRAFVVAFNFSFFWATASAVYLLQRFNVDRTEFDDIYFLDEERSPYGLPHLELDEHGVPKVPDANAK